MRKDGSTRWSTVIEAPDIHEMLVDRDGIFWLRGARLQRYHPRTQRIEQAGAARAIWLDEQQRLHVDDGTDQFRVWVDGDWQTYPGLDRDIQRIDVVTAGETLWWVNNQGLFSRFRGVSTQHVQERMTLVDRAPDGAIWSQGPPLLIRSRGRQDRWTTRGRGELLLLAQGRAITGVDYWIPEGPLPASSPIEGPQRGQRHVDAAGRTWLGQVPLDGIHPITLNRTMAAVGLPLQRPSVHPATPPSPLYSITNGTFQVHHGRPPTQRARFAVSTTHVAQLSGLDIALTSHRGVRRVHRMDGGQLQVIAPGPGACIWVGTSVGGLRLVSPDGHESHNPDLPPYVHDLHGSGGHVWVDFGSEWRPVVADDCTSAIATTTDAGPRLPSWFSRPGHHQIRRTTDGFSWGDRSIDWPKEAGSPRSYTVAHGSAWVETTQGIWRLDPP